MFLVWQPFFSNILERQCLHYHHYKTGPENQPTQSIHYKVSERKMPAFNCSDSDLKTRIHDFAFLKMQIMICMKCGRGHFWIGPIHEYKTLPHMTNLPDNSPESEQALSSLSGIL